MTMPTVITAMSFISVKSLPQVEDIVACGRRLLADRGVAITPETSRRYGFFLGTTFSNFAIRKANTEKYYTYGVRPINPADFPKGLISYLGGEVCAALGIKGFNSTLSSGVSSGVDALTQGVYFVARHKGSRALVIELHEVSKSNSRIAFSGISGLLIEAAPPKEQFYAEIMGIESVFEKAGGVEGLRRVIAAALKQYHLDAATSVAAYSAGSRGSLSGRRLSHALTSSSMIRATNSPADSGHCGVSALMQILKRKSWLKEKYILLLQPGQNSNSSCVLLRVSRRGGVSR